MTIVRPGDAVEGLRVRLIDLRGVVFDDGTRLELAERSGAPEPARAPLRPARGTAATEAPATATPAERSAAGSGPVNDDPTPGPLPTPKPGSYPLGARPTSDPAAPTAFPYPYPYAPH